MRIDGLAFAASTFTRQSTRCFAAGRRSRPSASARRRQLERVAVELERDAAPAWRLADSCGRWPTSTTSSFSTKNRGACRRTIRFLRGDDLGRRLADARAVAHAPRRVIFQVGEILGHVERRPRRGRPRRSSSDADPEGGVGEVRCGRSARRAALRRLAPAASPSSPASRSRSAIALRSASVPSAPRAAIAQPSPCAEPCGMPTAAAAPFRTAARRHRRPFVVDSSATDAAEDAEVRHAGLARAAAGWRTSGRGSSRSADGGAAATSRRTP